MTGILAAFDTEHALRRAVERLRAEKIAEFETYTPAALDEDGSGSPLPLVMFVAAMLGLVFFFALMTYADVWNYPMNIGGRPKFAWPSFVPIAFELSALCAMSAGFFGYFIACRLPHLHDPIDECDSFREAMRDGWFVAVRSEEAERLSRARAVLDGLHPAVIEDIP
jgi:hypothetical protein